MPISRLTRDRSIASYQLSRICLEKIQKMRGIFTRSSTERSVNERGQLRKIGPPPDRRHVVVIGSAHDIPLLGRFGGGEGLLAQFERNDVITIAMHKQLRQ